MNILTMSKSNKPYIDFAAVKRAVNIEQILEQLELRSSFRPYGNQGEIRSTCPIHHGDNDDEFSVNPAKNAWTCFGACRADAQIKSGGNHLDLVAAIEGVSIHEAAHLVNQWFDLSLEKKLGNRSGKSKQKTTGKPSASPPDAEGDGHSDTQVGVNQPLGFRLQKLDTDHPYLAERGISSDTIEEFGLGVCSKGFMSDRLVIPIENIDGELVAYLGRWPGEPPAKTPK